MDSVKLGDAVKARIEKIAKLRKELAELEISVLNRRIQRTTSGTFFVCLPKKWCEEHNIHRGSNVAITEQEDCLIIVP